MLHNKLSKHELLFNRKLRTWETKAIYIELQSYINPYYAKPYPVPRKNKSIFRKESEIIFKLCDLERK